jgi:hypothetical protein
MLVQSRRGCPMKCIYCTTPRLEGRQVRAWDPEQVAGWLKTWHQKWGLTRFYFVDNMFNCPAEYARRLCRAIRDLKLPLEWACLLNPAFPDRELIHLIRAGGPWCRWATSPAPSWFVQPGKELQPPAGGATLEMLTAAGLPCLLPAAGRAGRNEGVRRGHWESPAGTSPGHPSIGVAHPWSLAEGWCPDDNLLWPKFTWRPRSKTGSGIFLPSDRPASQLDLLKTTVFSFQFSVFGKKIE